MHTTTRTLTQHKRIALVAHDSCKKKFTELDAKNTKRLLSHIYFMQQVRLDIF